MYIIKKRMEVSGSHFLNLNYDSKCKNLHGHNWIITVTLKSEELDKNGMVLDFTKIKNIVNKLDHSHLNDILPFNPTAENIAKWLCDQIPFCVAVSVQETEGNEAIYEK